MENLFFIIAGILLIVIGIVLFWRERAFRIRAHNYEANIRRKMYELAILKDLSKKIGSSFNVERVIDIVTGSLHQFIEHATVSCMLLENEKISFKIYLEKSVNKNFIYEVRGRMKTSLETLLSKEISDKEIEERVSGAIVLEDKKNKIGSFFNIPLVIDEKVVGLLTVAHTKEGLYKEEDIAILYKIVAQASQSVTKLEQVVKTEQLKLGAIMESLIDGVIMTDRENKVLMVNPAAKKYLNLEDHSSIDFFVLTSALGNRFDINTKIEESISLDKIITEQNILINEKFFQIVVAPVKGESHIINDRILGCVVVFHDITKEKNSEKLKEEFTSLIVHELRGPLGIIKQVGEVMCDESVRKDKEIYNEYTKIIFESSSQMLELVNEILDVSKIESGEFALSTRSYNIKDVIKRRVDFFSTKTKDKKIKIITEITEAVPSKLEFDPIRIEQVLNYLLSNAVKYTKEGLIEVKAFIHKKGEKISKEADKNDIKWFIIKKEDKVFDNISDCVVVEITDSGEGISKIELEKMFAKFDKEEILTQNKQGKKSTSFGLVVVKGIIEAHGGIVGVGSREGEGSTFYFTINI